VLLAAAQYLGPLAATSIAWLALLAAAHVAGTRIGTLLRDRSTDEIARAARAQQHTPRGRAHAMGALAEHRKAVTRLASRTPVGRGTIALAVAGLMTGAAVGGAALLAAAAGRISPAGWLLGTLSSGILGGFFAYMSTSLVKMLRQALAEGAVHSRAPRPGERAQ
jgi:hypothetical protein